MNEPIRGGGQLSIFIGGARPPSARTVASLLSALNDYYRHLPGTEGELVLVEARRGSLELIIVSGLAVLGAVNTMVAFAKNVGSLVRGVQTGARALRSRRGPPERLVQAVVTAIEETKAPLRIGIATPEKTTVVEEVTVHDAAILSQRVAASASPARLKSPSVTREVDTQRLGEIAARVVEARRLNPGSQSELEAVLRAVVATLDQYTLFNLVSHMRSSGLNEAADLLERLAEESSEAEREPPLTS